MNEISMIKSSYDNKLYENIKKGIENCGGFDLDKGDEIIIKINLCDFRPPETGAITHPYFLNELLRYIKNYHKNTHVNIVESNATATNADMFIEWFNFLAIIKKWDASWVNLSKYPKISKDIKGRYFKNIKISKLFENSTYFISLAKLKTHSITKISCVLKNQFGCLPKKRKVIYHPYIDDVIVDLNMVMRPDFSIVDGIIGQGGITGPSYGVPVQSKIIFCGEDPVAVDAACSKYMGFRPSYVKHVSKAEASGVGSMKYNIIGNIEKLKNTSFNSSTYDWYIYRIMQYLQSRSMRK